ncbi:MAG: thioredoxin domain-containing protein, partial [Armatimonadetes bacterium]|nr:thioredoxin domain-containing protein [Armatimonadota bacterium]
STCHWCHVMERESFESDEIAALMNELFVNIKVDREERPDVDRLYMTFIHSATGSGGWPMSVFLTPELKPFYGGTYFPPVDAYGRPGFPTLLRSIARAWEQDAGGVAKAAQSALQTLGNYAALGAGEFRGSYSAIFDACYAQLERSFDEQWGGFGGAPKFPRPVQHDFLHAYSVLQNEETARQMSAQTLRMMADRGMNDQLGGGFHRYSVDSQWIVSHFEKMLYDQAQLTISYLEMFQMSGERYFADAAEKTLKYVWRDLTHLDGGFFAAEDADSLERPNSDHKEEGAFYVWKQAEIEDLLGEGARLFCDFYGVKKEGNAPREGDPHGEFYRKNILFEAQSIQTVAKMNGVSVREALDSLEKSRAILFEARKNRPRPHRDEKIIVAWNGLMISAFARAAVALNNTSYARRAQGAADFIFSELWDGQNLRRHFKDGAADVLAFCDDYAALSRACLDQYDATFEVSWLQKAEMLADRMVELFWDDENGGFFGSGADTRVLVRFKEDYDGAEPSANALAVEVGARLWHLMGREDWRERADTTVAAFGERLASIPSAMPLLLKGKMLLDAPPQHIVVAGGREQSRELLRAAQGGFAPFRSVMLLDEKSREFFAGKQPFLREMKPVEGKAAAYVCQNFACQRPVSSAVEVRDLVISS